MLQHLVPSAPRHSLLHAFRTPQNEFSLVTRCQGGRRLVRASSSSFSSGWRSMRWQRALRVPVTTAAAPGGGVPGAGGSESGGRGTSTKGKAKKKKLKQTQQQQQQQQGEAEEGGAAGRATTQAASKSRLKAQQEQQAAAATAQQQQPQRKQQAQTPPQQPQQAQQPAQQQQEFLYEPTFGLPVVRRRLSYNELLREIRLEKVAEMQFFSYQDNMVLDGSCLVVYKDGSVAQAYVPEDDYRIHYAMETNGVLGSRLAPAPTASQLNPKPFMSDRAKQFLVNVVPYLAVLMVYVATQFVRMRKGDADDREKIRRRKVEDQKRKEAEEAADRAWADVEELARDGKSLEAILKKYSDLPRDEVEAVVEKALREEVSVMKADLGVNVDAAEQLQDLKKFHELVAEQQSENDPQKEAEQMLKLKTMKIQKAKDPVKMRQIKEAKKKLKNVKLQYTDPQESIFFEDVAGIGDAKVELQEVVDFFRKPERFRASGARIPRGVLLCGPPGTGKTLLARAVAGEAGVTFLSLNASEFVEMFVGVGASRVRDLFSTARSMAPAIIFIDEIDSVGRIRGGAKGNDERDQTLNQMLSEMDGFDNESQVVVMAATNRRDVLDPALIRPGRFDRIINVALPDFNGRVDVLKVHLSKRSFSPDVDLHELAFETTRSSGAQLANLVNMAATFASQAGREEIHQRDFVQALEQERLGPVRAPFSDAARRRVAVMEAATALTCTLLPAIEPVVQVTIVPREKYPLGQTVVKINEQRELTKIFTKRYLQEQLLTSLAGRAAEELVYGPEELSTMNQRRLVTARRIVQKLVVSNAMTENPVIGPRTVSIPRVPGGRGLKQIIPKFVPYHVIEAADQEMESVLAEAYAQSKALVARNREALDRLVDGLLERDSLSGDEVREVVLRYGCKEDLGEREAAMAPFM